MPTDAPPDIEDMIRKVYGGVRQAVLDSYELPRWFYGRGIPVDAPHLKGTGIEPRTTLSAAARLGEVGCLLYYAIEGYGRMRKPGEKVYPMNVDELVQKWRKAIVGMAVGHDKDEVDRYEASIEECLTPLLAAPIKQVREFAPKLLEALKSDKSVPFLFWRSYEIWYEMVLSKAPDDEVKQLKTDMAREITELVEQDVKNQLPEAMIRALQWRSPATLEEVKRTVETEKAAGRPVRLRGRESCLFLEAGGTEEDPAVCVQI